MSSAGSTAPPAVSVICPTFNSGEQLSRTIESVLAQTYDDLELLIGDDGSTDGTAELAAGYARHHGRVRVLRLAHTGDPGLVRRALMCEVRGNVVGYIDHDDEWHPDHLQCTVAALTASAPVVVAGASYFREGCREPVLTRSDEPWDREIATVDPFAEPTRIVHARSVIGPSTNWRAARGGLEDWDLWWRMAANGVHFQTLATVSSTIRLASDSRRHRLRERVTLPLATARNGAPAADAARLVGAALEDPYRQDLAAWREERTRRSGAGGFPPPVVPDSAPVAEEPVSSWLVPKAAPGGASGWIVGFMAPYVDRRHGAAIAAVIRRRFPSVLRHARALLHHMHEVELFSDAHPEHSPEHARNEEGSH